MSGTRQSNELGDYSIQKVVGFFDIALSGKWPFAQYTIKVIQKGDDEFMAVPNMFVYNSKSESTEYVCGLGSTVMESIEEAIKMTAKEAVRQANNNPDFELHESDFRWYNWKPYQTEMPDGYVKPH